MQSIRHWVLTTFMLISAMMLIGCGQRATGGQTVEFAGEDTSVVDLPALVIDIQPDGTPTVGGMPLAALAAVAGVDPAALEQLAVPADLMPQLIESNIQHVQIDNSVDGILLLVNGEPLPSFVWDDESLAATADVVEMLDLDVALLDALLPFIRTAGVGVLIKFPVAEGNEMIPLGIVESESAAAAVAAREEFLDQAGRSPTIRIVVNYASDGTWEVGGLAQEQWSEMISGVPWEALNQDPGLLASMSEAGISTFILNTNPQGIAVSINEQPLPYISWENGELTNVLTLAAQLGLLDQALGADPNMEQVLALVQEFLPVVQASDVNLTVNFP